MIANPGTYVLASLTVDAPYGLGKVYSAADGEDPLRRYLQQPLTIYLGEADDRDDDRNNSAEARAQGASRLARGLNAFNAAKSLAQARSWALLASDRAAGRRTRRRQDVVGAAGIRSLGAVIAVTATGTTCFAWPQPRQPLRLGVPRRHSPQNPPSSRAYWLRTGGTLRGWGT